MNGCRAGNSAAPRPRPVPACRPGMRYCPARRWRARFPSTAVRHAHRRARRTRPAVRWNGCPAVGAGPVLRSTSASSRCALSHASPSVAAMIGRSDMLKPRLPAEFGGAAPEIIDTFRVVGERLAEDREHVAIFRAHLQRAVRRAAEEQRRIRRLIRLDVGVRAFDPVELAVMIERRVAGPHPAHHVEIFAARAGSDRPWAGSRLRWPDPGRWCRQ